MKVSKVIALCAAFLFIWIVGWSSLGVYLWHRNASPMTTTDIAAFKFRFGLVKNDGRNNYSIVRETTTIPMRFGDSSYGFQVIPPKEAMYTVQFVAHFLYPPKTISGDVYESNTPSADMRSVKTQMQGGYVEDLGFDPGDPVGDQSIDIWIDGKLVKTIKFTVTPPSSDQK